MGGARSRCTPPGDEPGWDDLADALALQFGDASLTGVRATHAMFVVAAEADEVQAWLRAEHPELTLMSAGQTIEIYKEAGLPADFVAPLRAGRRSTAATRSGTRGWRPRAG